MAFTVASCSVINLSLLLRPELWGPGKGVKGPSGATVPWRGRTGLSPVLGAGSCARLCWLQPESPGWRWPGPALSLAAFRLRPARGAYSLGSDSCGRLWRVRRVRRVRRAQGARAAPRSLQPTGQAQPRSSPVHCSEAPCALSSLRARIRVRACACTCVCEHTRVRVPVRTHERRCLHACLHARMSECARALFVRSPGQF